MKLKPLIGSIVLMTIAFTTNANHAGTAFDNTRELTVAGMVKEFKWEEDVCVERQNLEQYK